MQTRKNDRALPFQAAQEDGTEIYEPGLTKREFFAAAALQGVMANPEFMHFEAAKMAVKKADELIKALNETDTNGAQ